MSTSLQVQSPANSSREHVRQTQSMSANPPAASPSTPSLGPPELDPPSPARSHSGVHRDAPILSPPTSVPPVASSSSHRSDYICTPQHQDALSSIDEYLPPHKLEKTLTSFSLTTTTLTSKLLTTITLTSMLMLRWLQRSLCMTLPSHGWTFIPTRCPLLRRPSRVATYCARRKQHGRTIVAFGKWTTSPE